MTPVLTSLFAKSILITHWFKGEYRIIVAKETWLQTVTKCIFCKCRPIRSMSTLVCRSVILVFKFSYFILFVFKPNSLKVAFLTFLVLAYVQMLSYVVVYKIWIVYMELITTAFVVSALVLSAVYRGLESRFGFIRW